MHKFHSLSVYAGITGSLLGTASLSSNAISSSYAGTASAFLGTAVSASYAQTASVALNVDGFVNFPSGLDVTGSLNVSGSITGSLLGTSSWATNAVSSSFATTASYATIAQNVLGSITSASYAATASLLLGSIESASYATTASFALNGGSGTTFPYSGSAVITGSLIVTGSTQLTGVGVTGSVRLAGGSDEVVLGTLGTRIGASYFYFASPTDSNTIAPIGSIGGGFIYNNNLGRSITIGPGGWEFDSFSTNHRTGLGVGGTMRGRAPGLTGSGDATINMVRIDGKIGDSSTFLWNSSASISALNIITEFSASDASTGQFTGLRVHPQISGSTLQSNLVLLDVGTQGITKFSISASGDVTTQRLVATQISSSLFGTASWATNAVSSSFATTASYATTASAADSITFVPATASFATTSSFAQTAATASSFAGFVAFPNGLDVTGSLIVWGNAIISGSIEATSGITGSLLGTSSWATNAISASFATTASYASSGDGYINFPDGLIVTGSTLSTGGFTGSLQGTSSWATNAITASIADSITFTPATASFSTTASYAQTSNTASYALSASIAQGLIGYASFPQGLTVTGSTLSTGGFTGSLQGTASWATDAISASFATTASYAQSIDGFISFPSGLAITGSLIVTGSTIVTGSLNVTEGITGSLLGTASWAENAITASAATSITFIPATASFATTASAATSITFTPATASFSISSSFAPPTFPFTGSAVISGSLIVTGSTSVQGDFTATTKSFLIDHQKLIGKKLVYGVVEAPEHSVLVRGTLRGNTIIELPEEWLWLVDMDTITVQLTPIGKHQALSVADIRGNQIHIDIAGQWPSDIHCYYLVQATRKDVEPLQTVI